MANVYCKDVIKSVNQDKTASEEVLNMFGQTV